MAGKGKVLESDRGEEGQTVMLDRTTDGAVSGAFPGAADTGAEPFLKEGRSQHTTRQLRDKVVPVDIMGARKKVANEDKNRSRASYRKSCH